MKIRHKVRMKDEWKLVELCRWLVVNVLITLSENLCVPVLE